MTLTNEVRSSIMRYQQMILGILCILLAPLSILFGLFGDNPDGWYMSISSTYYANSNMFMIGELVAIGIFFLSYHGYDKRDTILSIIQGICALGIVAFPTKIRGLDEIAKHVGVFGLPINISQIFHIVSTSLLCGTFWINLMFLFTLSDGNITKKKKLRNLIYRICGIIVVVGLLTLIFGNIICKVHSIDWFPITLISEFIMFVPFGFSYVVKSGCLKCFNDDEEEKV